MMRRSALAPVVIDGESLQLDQFDAVARRRANCVLEAQARAKVEAGQVAVRRALETGEPVYGVNTGFGDLAGVRIAEDRLAVLQRRLILSHASGLGEPLDGQVVRGMLLLRANTLARGHSGVRPQIVEALIAFLNSDVLPVVPSRGSVGASGDLAPLAHLALPLIGCGRVRIDGRIATAAEGLRRAGLAALELGPKEGLALINGTQAMTSLLALSCLDARRLVRVADLTAALSTEALRGTDTAFDPRLHALRRHRGQCASAANLWSLMHGSAIRESHREGDVRVQDPYSIRCAPQVHGAVRDVLDDVEAKVAIEMNAVTDNPLVFPGGLPPFLARDAGLNSGFMLAQVTAAALVAENKVSCHPASIDSIPTSADKEDHVSMGMGAALKLRPVVANVRRVLAIELVAAAQGIDLLRPLRSSERLETVHRMVRERIVFREEDREMAVDLERGIALLDELDPVLDSLD